MESPEVPSSPTEYEDDLSYPCKGCDLILEEGKAFELAGNRWHIDCFRCNTCGTLLDSDANLLLLADGSLICNQCTYSCTACGNKIEDLAILTGDQAFCAGCFRCRNCKRKIENLRYARTSQGIFCMSCHESLMARRRKKQKATKQASISNTPSPMLALDKSLPAIPQTEDDEDDETSFARPPLTETPTELSPRPARPAPSRNPGASATPKPNSRGTELSPTYSSTSESTPRLPRSYNSNRHSQISHHSDLSELMSQIDGSDPYSSFIPLVLDPSPGHASQTQSSYRPESVKEASAPPADTRRPLPPRTVSTTSDTPSYYETDKYENFGRKPVPESAGSASAQTSHIAYQEKGRPPVPADQNQERTSQDKKRPTVNTDASGFPSRVSSRSAMSDASVTSSKQPGDSFKLGEVPRERKKSFTSSSRAPNLDDIPISFSPVRASSIQASYFTNPAQKEPPKPPVSQTPLGQSPDQMAYSASDSTSSGNTTAEFLDNEISKTKLAPDAKQPGSLSLGRNPSFRHSTHVPPSYKPTYLDTSLGDSSTVLPLPLRTPVSDLSADEDIARMLGQETSPSLLRKVSNAVRHGRSFSDLAGRIRTSPKWSRLSDTAEYYGPQSGGFEITNPIVSTESKEETTLLKNELRRSTIKIAELEMKLNNNETASVIESNIIEEQKSTVAGLESKRVTRLKELEVLFKGSGGTEWMSFRADALRSLANELEDLRKSYEAQIQALISQKNELLEETAGLTRMRDQAIQESEQLNLKNAQLADLNNEITRQIQGKFQQHKGTIPTPHGLGILNKDGSDFIDANKAPGGGANQTGQQDNEDERIIIAQPTVINVRSKSFPKKSVWKKGGAAIIKGAGKGFNKVFNPDGQNFDTASTHTDSASLISANSDSPFLMKSATTLEYNNHGGLEKIFSTQKLRFNKKNGSSTNFPIPTNGVETPIKDTNPEGYIPLFGYDLEARAIYEGKSIPHVVSRCIQEVEARGMDFEGIYRKNGGASSMRTIQEAFEKGEELDIGESIDICGVTSVLKQYFRRLPTPIITPAIYDDFLKSTKFVNDEQRVEELKQIMGRLSSVHQDVLGYLIFHLKKVSERESQNLMNSRNLAVVFAPTLMWHKDNDREMTDMHDKNNAIQFLIDHGESIFFS